MGNIENEQPKSKYELLLERVKKSTGIDTITISTSPHEIIVDDYSKPECLVIVSSYYNALYINYGDNSKVGITEQDLIDFNIITPISLSPHIVSLPDFVKNTPVYNLVIDSEKTKDKVTFILSEILKEQKFHISSTTSSVYVEDIKKVASKFGIYL